MSTAATLEGWRRLSCFSRVLDWQQLTFHASVVLCLTQDRGHHVSPVLPRGTGARSPHLTGPLPHEKAPFVQMTRPVGSSCALSDLRLGLLGPRLTCALPDTPQV